MKIELPKELITGLDEAINRLNGYGRIKGYKYLTGNCEEAYFNDFDDSNWEYFHDSYNLKQNSVTTWFRFKIQLPDNVADIPVQGSGARLFFPNFAVNAYSVDLYVDEEHKLSEKTWIDFKVPEVRLTENAIPGQVFNVAVKINLEDAWIIEGVFAMDFIVDRVQDAEFEIRSFKDELAYACRFNEASETLPEVFEILSDCLNRNEGILELVENIKLAREILKPMTTEAKKNTVHLIGHAHIDMNWFWSIEETHDLIKRDFGTMLNIMEEYPDFTFSQSQCATYEMAEKHYPEIFEKMKKVIKAGNWDVTASTWVEGDMNIVCGESIVRQILYARKYHKEKFGIEPRILWEPDTFGHSANVPQIAKKSGIDYYYFMRCGRKNPIFWWEGLDGSKILAFSSPYNADMNAAAVTEISSQFEDTYGLRNSMFVYGVGDHGGGPTRRDIKRAIQLNESPALPKLEFSTTHAFFDNVVKEESSSIPVEKGELNFIFDGCYTSHADIKKYNRQCENKLISTEMLAAMGSFSGSQYDFDGMERSWRSVLFNQFHDIMDGTGTKGTYVYSAKIAEEALSTLAMITEKSIMDISSRIKVPACSSAFVVFNTTGWKRSEYIKINRADINTAGLHFYDTENKLPAQTCEDSLAVFVKDIPALGYKVICLNEQEAGIEFNRITEIVDNYNSEAELETTYYRIETKYYEIEINKNSGEIASLYDKEYEKYVVRREKIAWRLRNGVLNTLQVHYEVPTGMSAWTIGAVRNIKNLLSGAESHIREDGPLVKVINFKHKFDSSTISQDIIIYNDSRRIDFKTHVEWNEFGSPEKDAPMLKACFVPDIDNTHVTCEIPYGTMDRLCRDVEIPALKWIDISDENYGFSLLNDCKYGHKVKGNAMEITLIRSSWHLDRKSDVGSHDFTYSILPHKGSWKESETIKEGYCLNNDLIVVPVAANTGADLPEAASFVQLDNKNVVISAFKPAESGKALVLRIYEGAGDASSVKVRLGFDVARIEEVDLNENKVYSIVVFDGREFEIHMDKFEIKTLKLFLKPNMGSNSQVLKTITN
jgi:alpha-mannosidase